jgi:hypothetical protein
MKPLVQVPLKWGAIAGILGVALEFGLYAIGRHPFLIPVYLDFRIFLFGIFIFFTLRELRDFNYNGTLFFWEGLIASFLFTLFFASIAATGIGVLTLIVPEFISSYVKLQTEIIKSLPADVVEKIGKEVVQRNLDTLPATNGFGLALTYFVQCFLISFFISIVLSVILRRQPKT